MSTNHISRLLPALTGGRISVVQRSLWPDMSVEQRVLAAGRFAQPVAAVAALVVLTFWLPTAHAHWSISPLWVIALLLGLGLVADRLRGGEAVRRFVQGAGAAVGPLVVLLTLAFPPAAGYRPEWPLWWMAALLGLGLFAGPLAQRVSRPHAKSSPPASTSCRGRVAARLTSRRPSCGGSSATCTTAPRCGSSPSR
jgi:hypothetical protein